MKGQTQALTAVLITAVTVGAVATAYIWGMPLLEKRQSKAAFNDAERDIFDLHDSIISVSQSGSGTTSSVELSLEDGDLEVNPGEDYISITTEARDPPYPSGVWTLVKGKSLQNLTIGTGDYGVQGDDLPGVVAVRAASGAGTAVVTYRIEFRNLYVDTPTGARLKKIDLTSTGRTSGTGDITLLVSNEGTAEDQVTVSTGQEFNRRKTRVNIDIQ